MLDLSVIDALENSINKLSNRLVFIFKTHKKQDTIEVQLFIVSN
jgi:hypothetical protein